MLKEEVIKTYEERISIIESTMEIILEGLEDAKKSVANHLKERDERLKSIAFYSKKPEYAEILAFEKGLLQFCDEDLEHERTRIVKLNEKLKKHEAELAKAEADLEDAKERWSKILREEEKRLKKEESGMICEGSLDLVSIYCKWWDRNLEDVTEWQQAQCEEACWDCMACENVEEKYMQERPDMECELCSHSYYRDGDKLDCELMVCNPFYPGWDD